MTLPKEKARELFEAKCRELHAKGTISLPLGAMEVNGKFSHYMDSDTDSAWVGFCAGLGVMTKERDALAKKLLAEQKSHETTVDQRDHAEGMADRLSQAIMGITGRDIGEHSSANCPWANAIEHAEEHQSERDALVAHMESMHEALAPFARAWQRREPKGDPNSKAYQRHLERALGAFYSNGNLDDSALTGEHLRAAARALSAPIDTASTSLLIAEKQAAAVREVAADVRADYGHHTQYSVSLLACAIEGYADALSRQAEGGEPNDD